MSIFDHTSVLCKYSFSHIRNIRRTRNCFDHNIVVSIAASLIHSVTLNSSFSNLPVCQLYHPSFILTATIRAVTRTLFLSQPCFFKTASQHD
jgi:hypothetical protein